ncbi:hypothetical protein PRZ48_005342 [Zasmidium cellare]|uniref:Metallo-beta-lactamase domain-containing protein n=1 Tax=Zasmidium cellare TaxID=395010 RepID=A0ABR0ETK1_ZASCE|nr:hypothetical protein PRZ48_005342 [Zasmidium cellare]
MSMRIPFNEGYWNDYLAAQNAQLPAVGAVDDISPLVVRINGGNPGYMQLQGTNTYLIGAGKNRILIDTGEASRCWISRIVDVLKKRGIELKYVLLTHWHGDHTGGVADLLAYDQNLSTNIYKHKPDYFQQNITHGQVFAVEGATLRAIFTPGHAVDHMCFHFQEENALFTGDNVLGHGYSVIQDLGTYLNSLRVMQNEQCSIGYPGHGARIDDLPAKMKDYIQHKQVRVDQVYGVLARSRSELERIGQAGKGGMTLNEIIKSMYGDVPRDLMEHALVPFLTQALWKLAEDLKVGFEPGLSTQRKWFARPMNVRIAKKVEAVCEAIEMSAVDEL